MALKINLKKTFFLLLLFISFKGFSQEKLDKKIDEAITIYEDGDVDKAYTIWKEIDFAIDNLKFDASKKTIALEIFNIRYTIDLHTNFESPTQAKEYLKKSYFYSYLQEKTNK